MNPLQVDRLTHDHRAVERLGGELRRAIVRQDAASARGRLAELAQEFHAHVTRENADVSADLVRCDAAGRARAHAALRTAAETSDALTTFAATWGSAAAISRDLDVFRLEVEHWLVRLGRLILDEEAKLYPYLHTVAAVPSFSAEPEEEPVITQRISRDAIRRALAG